ALYSLMNYAGLKLGTWYPRGGFGRVVEAMEEIAARAGANFKYNAAVEKISIKNNTADGLIVDGQKNDCDAVVASADYHNVETNLLDSSFRNYDESYWNSRTLAPSCLIFYLGVSQKVPSLQHHMLFFETDLLQHSKEIYTNPQWPSKPLFYVCSPSQTDSSI